MTNKEIQIGDTIEMVAPAPTYDLETTKRFGKNFQNAVEMHRVIKCKPGERGMVTELLGHGSGKLGLHAEYYAVDFNGEIRGASHSHMLLVEVSGE